MTKRGSRSERLERILWEKDIKRIKIKTRAELKRQDMKRQLILN